MLPMETSVTFIGACANEIIRRNNSGFLNEKSVIYFYKTFSMQTTGPDYYFFTASFMLI
jgi:hypothetical protein